MDYPLLKRSLFQTYHKAISGARSKDPRLLEVAQSAQLQLLHRPAFSQSQPPFSAYQSQAFMHYLNICGAEIKMNQKTKIYSTFMAKSGQMKMMILLLVKICDI